jgi:hypothetical protein
LANFFKSSPPKPYKNVTLYQHKLISKGDNGKSYLSFNSLMARVISLLTVYYNGEVLILEMNQSKTRIACDGHVC